MAICDKITINKWTYERSHKSLNSYLIVKYNKIYSNTKSWKTLQEESLWQEDFDNLYFWNTLNKTHRGILVWNGNKRLHTLYKKYVHKEKKEMTHVKIGESHISTNINPNISTVYVKWSQDQYTWGKCKRKKRKYIPHNRNTPSNRKISYANFPPMYMTTFIPKLLLLSVTSDKG